MKEHLGHYDIIAELGRGGMGVVYKGYETSLNRYVAIKVLAESLAHDESVKERFLREARSMAALNDPHIIAIYFIGDDSGQTYFVMEFVDGESLGSLLKREGKLKPEQAAKIVYQTAQGLATAHDKGVIHRDIKPGNLMITAKGAVKIADFGIALSSQDFSKKLTSTGEFVGTPGYLSPEVCQGKPVDQRSDIFSLGIVLFECLAGRMPFTDESPLGLMLEVVKAEIPDVRTLNAEVDPELERILARMVAKDPTERYQSCQELVADLGKHPLIANHAGALALPVETAATGPLRTTPTRISQAAMTLSADATFAGEPLTAQRAGMTAPSPGLPRAAVPPARRTWAIGAAAAAALAVSAWAFRSDLPFVAPAPAGTAPTTAQDAMTSNEMSTTAATQASSPAPTRPVAGDRAYRSPSGAGSASDGTDADGGDAGLLDSQWLNDVPDEALAPGNDDAAAAYATAPGYPPPAYAPVVYYPPYAVPAFPVAYVSPSPWRFGFGLTIGLGTGWWGARYAYAPVSVGPVLQPGFAGSRPLPGGTMPATPVGATPAPANRPLPGATVSRALPGAAGTLASGLPVAAATAGPRAMPAQPAASIAGMGAATRTGSNAPARSAVRALSMGEATLPRTLADRQGTSAPASRVAGSARAPVAAWNRREQSVQLAAQHARREQVREQRAEAAQQAREAKAAHQREVARENHPRHHPQRQQH
ncbi:MAG: protein kinase [Proteobacteria bacterium]|nr:protein kinase [Pseudomonadota bacterium]